MQRTLWCMKKDSSKPGFSKIFNRGKKNIYIQSDVCCLISYFYLYYYYFQIYTLTSELLYILESKSVSNFYIRYEGHGDPFPTCKRGYWAVRHVAVLRGAWVAATVVVYLPPWQVCSIRRTRKTVTTTCLHMFAWKTAEMTWILTDLCVWHLTHLIIRIWEQFPFWLEKKTKNKIKISRTFSFFRAVVVIASLSSVDVGLLLNDEVIPILALY